jgi:hypothetical protein
MLIQNASIDGHQCIMARETDGKYTKMSLQSRINSEAASCWIHGRNILCIVNFFQSKLGSVIPVAIVQMLSNQ